MIRQRRDQLLVGAALVLMSWLIGDWLGAATAVFALSTVHAGMPARLLPLVGAGLVMCAALAWLVGNATRWGVVTFDLVLRNPWPGRFGLAAVVLLMVGVALDLTSSRNPPMEEDIDEGT